MLGSRNTPTGIIGIILLYSFIALLSIIYTLAVVFTLFDPALPSPDTPYTFPTIVAFGVYSIFCLIAVVGLYNRSKWGWGFTLFLSFLGIFSGIVETIDQSTHKALFILVVSSLVLWYLFRPKVRSYFQQG